MSRTTSTALRLVAAGALGLPLTLGIAGVANAAPAHEGSSGCAGGGHFGGGHSGGGHSGGGHSGGGSGAGGSARGGQVAYQGGSLVGALAQVDPALNVGGILNSGDVDQVARTANSANSGIAQSAGPGGGGQHSFRAGDLVSALLQVDPAVNVGGVGNSGDVRQVAVAENSANSGTAQSGGRRGGHEGGHGDGHGRDHGGHGSSGGQYATQGGGLIGLDLQLAPALNLGGILNSGDVHQTAITENTSNSGITQSSGHGGGHGSSRGSGQHATQGGRLIGLDLQLAPALNLGGILNSGDVHQTAATDNTSNSGISQHR